MTIYLKANNMEFDTQIKKKKNLKFEYFSNAI